MVLNLFLPILAGCSIVLQGVLNRNSSFHIGLVSAIFLNAIVFSVLSGILWIAFKYEYLPEFASLSAKSFTDLQWWQYLPGICGFVIVLCTPLAINFLGANLTFATVIITQLVFSMLWDSFSNKTVPSISNLAGVGIMIVGLIVLMSGKR